jgi:hypothetical protein
VLALLKNRLQKLPAGKAVPAVDEAKILMLDTVFVSGNLRVDSLSDLGDLWS